MKLRKRHFLAIFLTMVLLVNIFPDVGRKTQAASPTGKSYTYISDNQELKITLTEVRENDYWYEYYLAVTNQSSQSICDWSIALNCSDISKYSKAFECSASKDESTGILTVKGAGNHKVIAAGSSVSESNSLKLGFGSSVSFSGGKIEYSYGTQSSAEDTADGVGYGNTYLGGYTCRYNLTGETKSVNFSDTPVGKHGKLHVSGTRLMDEYNQPVILRGASMHGMHWSEMTPFVNKAAFQNLRDEWGVTMIRLVNYVTQGGYTQGAQSSLDDCIQRGVSYADDLGMYAIIDWHIHAENPNDTKAEAIQFFEKYSKMYGSHNNIIYEICNEPTGTPWSQIKPYAQEVVNTIRANDPDAIIVVGTNTWSQDVDEVAVNGGKIDDPNVMYTIHFYSGSHSQSLRDKVSTALDAGTPVFCTEFGICDASGNGGFNLNEADIWIDFLEEKGISYCCWSLCNKDESASMISPQCAKKSGWVASDLGATGAWLINTYRSKRSEVPDVTEKPAVTDSPSGTAGTVVIPTIIPGIAETTGPKPTVIPNTTATVPSATQTASPDAPATAKPVLPTNTPVEDQQVSPSNNSIAFESENYQVYVTERLKLKTSEGNHAVTIISYQSSDAKVAAVSKNGIVHGKKAGTVTITAVLSNGSQICCQVTVRKPKVKLKKTSFTLKKKKTVRIQIKKKISSDSVKKYKVSGKKIVKVSRKGVVKGLRKGKTTVKVIMKSGVTVKCRIKVK